MKNLVKILIPIYTSDLTTYEKISLDCCYRTFSEHPIVFVKPETLDISELLNSYPRIKSENFKDHYFKNIIGYNRLLLSAEFYNRFRKTDLYILIYQLDAYVFNHDIESWCVKDFDYIGAPWILKSKYQNPILKAFLYVKSFFYTLRKKPFRALMLGNKVGNGGFSLRKVESHYQAIKAKQKEITLFLEKAPLFSEYNEDSFWATQNPQFKYPKLEEALKFSFDIHPGLCFKLNHKQLPFGCHGWSKPEHYLFWKEIIAKHENTL